jgi:hypothetical protein
VPGFRGAVFLREIHITTHMQGFCESRVASGTFPPIYEGFVPLARSDPGATAKSLTPYPAQFASYSATARGEPPATRSSAAPRELDNRSKWGLDT